MKRTSESLKLPKYWKRFYGWLYGNKFWSAFLSKNWVQTFLTLGNNNRLSQSVLREIKRNDKVLQIGVTFGHQIDDTAERIGQYGQYDLMDVSLTQLNLVKQKYQYVFPQMDFIQQTGADKIKKPGYGYDVVICYMLLHEVPPQTKSKIVGNALSVIKENGKVIFVDYHRPLTYHPLRYIVRMINRLWQPFAEKLWDLEIGNYCKNRLKYNWRKTLFFGKMYQKTVVTKRAPDILEEF